MAKMKFTATLKAKDGIQCLINQLKYSRAAEFMRAYEQQGPWPDMLSGWDLTYSMLLYPLPMPKPIFHMDLGDFAGYTARALCYNRP